MNDDIDCPDYVREALSFLRHGIDPHVKSNPFDNTAARFACPAFTAQAYSWNDEEGQPWNFAWRDLRIRWYKHHNRGVELSRPLPYAECVEMIVECAAAILEWEAIRAG